MKHSTRLSIQSSLVLLTLLAIGANAQNFDPNDWSVRCWNAESRLWEDRGMEAMNITVADGVTRITNSSGIHRHAHLVIPAKLSGDFTFTIELAGGYELGFLNRAGKDEMLYVELDETAAAEFQTFELSREGTRYTIKRNGRSVPLVHFHFDYGEDSVITLAIKDGESARIRSCRLDASSPQ